jgi:tRNA(fMet)-specific endonuclease VapC
LIKYILDTDVISLLQNGNEEVYQSIIQLAKEEIGVSVISYEEQIIGRLAYINSVKTPAEKERGYQLLAQTAVFFAQFEIVNYSQEAIAGFEHLKSLKLNVGSNDLRIAAIALSIHATVITRNHRDFSRVTNLSVFVP